MIGYNFQNAEQRTQRGSEIELRFDLFTIIACSAYNMNTDIVLRNHYFNILLLKLNDRARTWPASIKKFKFFPLKLYLWVSFNNMSDGETMINIKQVSQMNPLGTRKNIRVSDFSEFSSGFICKALYLSLIRSLFWLAASIT